MAKKATLDDIQAPAAHYITTQYTNADGEPLMFGIKKISVGAYQRAMAASKDKSGQVDGFELSRLTTRECVVEPVLTPEKWLILEGDIEKFGDLGKQISEYSMPKEVAQTAALTFRGGEPGSGVVSGGSPALVSVPAGPDAPQDS